MGKLKNFWGRILNWRSANAWQRWKNWSLLKKIGLAGALLVLALSGYLLAAWRLISPGRLALADLQSSWATEKICHEECAARRRQAEEIVVSALRDDLKNGAAGAKQSLLARQLQNYFIEVKADPEFLREIIKVWHLAAGTDNPPSYFKDYLERPDGNKIVQAAIISSFSSANLSPEDSGEAAGADPLAYYFKLLESDQDQAIKEAAISALSNYPDKSRAFNIAQLNTLQTQILSPKTNSRLRSALVLLLDDYYPLFPEESAQILQEIYEASTSSDLISRAFAADLLNRRAAQNLSLPAISAAQWQEYYNN